MKVLTCAEMMHSHRIKSAKGEDMFSDLNTGAIVVLENAEILFNSHSNDAIGYILFQIRRVTTTFIFIMQGEINSAHILSFAPIQKCLFSHFHV